MEKAKFESVLAAAAADRSCTVADLKFDDDENVFEVTLTKQAGTVDLQDCEYVHRAILKAFDRNIEDYALTVSSQGMDPAEADEILKTINEQ